MQDPTLPLGLAVSGGPDSVAMLLLAKRAGIAIEVATVDHRLRTASADECALVARLCHDLGDECTTLRVDLAAGNLQEEARNARYRALGKWAEARGLCAVATAHHADDQAETLVMRLNRGSGLSGLAGIRGFATFEGCAVPIIRPLLSFRRAELREVVASAHAEFAVDPSNADDRYDRVRIRKALAGADWLDPVAFAQSAAYLASAERALDSLAEDLWRTKAATEGDTVKVPHTGTMELDGRLVQRAIAELGGKAGFGEAAMLLARMERKPAKGNIGGVLIERSGDLTFCRREPQRKTA